MQNTNSLHHLCNSLNPKEGSFLEDRPLRARSQQSNLYIKLAPAEFFISRRARQAHTQAAFEHVQRHVTAAAKAMFGEGALSDRAVMQVLDTHLPPLADKRSTLLTCRKIRVLARDLDVLLAGQAHRPAAAQADSKHALAAAPLTRPSHRLNEAHPVRESLDAAGSAPLTESDLLSAAGQADDSPDELEKPLAISLRTRRDTKDAPPVSPQAIGPRAGPASTDQPKRPVIFHRKTDHLGRSTASGARTLACAGSPSDPSHLSTPFGRQLLRELEKSLAQKTAQLSPEQAGRLRAKLERLAQIAEQKSRQQADGDAPKPYPLLEDLATRSAYYVAVVDRSCTPESAWNAVIRSHLEKSKQLTDMYLPLDSKTPK